MSLTKLGKEHKQRFLKAFGMCGVIGEAAKLANIGRQCHYDWMKTDADYPQQFEQAKEEVADKLEMELMDRVFVGTPEQVLFQGQPVYEQDADGNITDKPLVIHRKSDTLLIFALKGVKPDKYCDRFRSEISHTGTMTIRDAQLSKLSDEQLAALELITLTATTGTGKPQ